MVTVQIVERPAFYSELEFYEWNLFGKTEPSHRGRGKRGERGRMFSQFNLYIRVMIEQQYS